MQCNYSHVRMAFVARLRLFGAAQYFRCNSPAQLKILSFQTKSFASLSPTLATSSIRVVGVTHYSLNDDNFRSSVKVNDNAELQEEEDNPVDPNAIVIKVHGQKIGYVGKPDQNEVRKLLEKDWFVNQVGSFSTKRRSLPDLRSRLLQEDLVEYFQDLAFVQTRNTMPTENDLKELVQCEIIIEMHKELLFNFQCNFCNQGHIAKHS
eukprot:m.139629 g.139629  ORF g.139629 m.139629 type:complete len:207 (+) comp14803_c0_seq4:84-704(+)